MATDATGTPTSLGIPKYNPNVDAPSGLGFNAAMDAIDALITARGPAPTSSGVKVWNNGTGAWDAVGGTADGTKFLRDDNTWAVAGGPGGPVTSLPGSPTDGQQAILTDSLTAPTYHWLFQYESSISDANKWVFIGGSPATSQNNTSNTTTSTIYVDPTNNVSVTVPRAGIYIAEAVADPHKDVATDAGNFAVALSVAGSDIIQTETVFYAQANIIYAAYATIYRTGSLAASDVIKLRYKSGTGGNFSLRQKSLSVIPVRVA